MQAALFRMNPVQYPSCRRAYRMKSRQVQRDYICLPSLCLHYVKLNKRIICKDRRTMAITRHMRRSAFFPGRPGGLIREITWKGNMRVELIGRKAKNFRGVFTFFQYAFCLSFPKSGRFVTSARKIEIFCRYKKIDTYL